MAELTMTGCRTTPLGGYLAGLGTLSAVARLGEPDATGYWRRQTFVLNCQHSTVDDLAADMVARFEPEPIVSPWNRGSGFAANGKSVAAERALAWVRDSTDGRLGELRRTVLAADRVLARIRAGGHDPAERKDEVLRRCRNELPDRAVRWLDAAVALGDGDPAYSRLLGTGGNLGRLELSSAYLQHARTVLEHRSSQAWLASALDGHPRAALTRSSLGQYDPVSIGNPEESRELGNPWLFVLLAEGALLFATAMVRRYGTGYARAALPFQVRATPAGLASAAPGEASMGELWAPEWSAACTVTDVAHLLSEGRADWHGGPARTGLDFVRAVAGLGVDRGVEAFQRHVFAERNGQSPLAVPAGRLVVTRRGGVGLLASVDRWLESVRRVNTGAIVAPLRAVEQALFTHARSGDAADLAEVLAAVGRCHDRVSRSSAARAEVGPLRLDTGQALFDELIPAARRDPALRIALGLVCAHDPRGAATLGGLRPLLSPVGLVDGRVRWTAAATPSGSMFDALADAARRRGFPGVTGDPDPADPPAVRGTRLGFLAGPALLPGDLALLAGGDLDHRRVGALLTGLLTVDWSGVRHRVVPGRSAAGADPAVDLLLPFTADGYRDSTVSRLLPNPAWPVLLRAGQHTRVLSDAARRIRISGVRHVITPAGSGHDGTRLAALLLARTTPVTRRAALARVADLTDHSATDEETA